MWQSGIVVVSVNNFAIFIIDEGGF